MYNDPETISFNPYHHHHHHHQNPNSDKWGATTEDEISYSNRCSQSEKGMENYNNSGAESPRLWKNSPSPSHPLLFSQNSRAEAIVRGQWELMEMVKNMPDDSYELSLKDMVEHQRSVEAAGAVGSEDVSLHQRAVVRVKRIDRNLSIENKGMFLNMVFPFSLKSKKKKPGGLKGERDWWKKKFRGSSDSDSSRTSNNTSSSSSETATRKRNGLLSSCWPFFHSRSNKSEK